MTVNELTAMGSLVSESDATAKKGQYRLRIIEGNIEGSSGFWPRETLESDGPTAFPIGTHVYLDHLSETESWDRPEGSVLKLAGVINSTPVYEEASEENRNVEGLYANVQFFPMYHDFIEAIREHVGMSIRAVAEAEPRSYGDRMIPYITKILEGLSVDVVTKPGAGGRILEAIESRRPNVPKHIAEKLQLPAAKESNKGEINMADLTEETASALVAGIGELTKVLAGQAAEKQEAQKQEGQASDQDTLFDAIAKVQGADLAESARERVLAQLRESKDFGKVDELIAAEAEYARKIAAESGVVGKQQLDNGSGYSPKLTLAEARKSWNAASTAR